MVILADGLHMDWSIRLGDLVSFGGFVIGGLSVIFMMRQEIKELAIELGFFKETFKRETEMQNAKIDRQGEELQQFAQLLTLMGRYEERFASMRRELEELKRGRGFILDGPKGE